MKTKTITKIGGPLVVSWITVSATYAAVESTGKEDRAEVVRDRARVFVVCCVRLEGVAQDTKRKT